MPDKVVDLRANSSELPEIKSGVFVKLSGLGGCGELKTASICSVFNQKVAKCLIKSINVNK